ncbi:MAG: hypothetical protein IKE69_12830 [Thermoguttaceae bacterium]|nr:hypothetical protein [Thermoguttaceae bacterium]
MSKTSKWAVIFLAAVIAGGIGLTKASAQGLGLFRAISGVEAEPNKEYPLTDSDGLWFIMASKFTGTEARKTANRLVYELRKKYKLPAYMFRYDNHDDDLRQLGGGNRSYQYLTAPPEVYAVLIGSFPSADDPALQETLTKVKRTQPESLKNNPESKMVIKEFEMLAQNHKEYVGYGPLGKAHAVPNPMIPKEYFAQKGVVDSFLEKINSDSKFSLLRNPKMYTVRVATFAGKSVMDKDSAGDSKWNKSSSEFQDAGVKAAALCAALRKQGVEAWEFHDRDCSFVTIGSFDSFGTPNADGTTEMDPEIFKLMEKYKGKIVDAKGGYEAYTANVEIKGKGREKVKVEIPFDIQPVIIMVPQLPANAKKVQMALAQRHRDEEQRSDAHFRQSLENDQMIQNMKYGNMDRASVSEGVRISDEGVARMISGQSPEPAPTAQTGTRAPSVAQTVSPPAARSAYAAAPTAPAKGSRVLSANGSAAPARSPERVAARRNAPTY